MSVIEDRTSNIDRAEGDPQGPAEGVDPTGGDRPREGWDGARLREGEAEDTRPSQVPATLRSLDQRGNIFFAAVEMTRMPMVLTDPNQPDNPIVFANRAFQELTGYQEAEIIGRNCRFLQGARSSSDQIRELRESLLTRRAFSVELLNYKRDGTAFWNAVYIAPVFDTDGRLIFFFASQLDITRRTESEQAFRQAQKEKMDSLGQLTAGVAHDFNNLLQVLTGNLEMIRTHLVDEQLHRYLDNAFSAAERGARLTRQLLSFARKARLEPTLIDLNALLHECGEMLESAVGTEIELLFSLRRRLPMTLVDHEHLERAILNVLVNARDAMPSGGTIGIATSLLRLEAEAKHRSLSPGTYVVLTVTDTGQGMSPATLKRAVEPFFTTKPLHKGTGLGLAMLHGFVEQSCGHLEIESELGRGTVVRMIFPASEETGFAERQAAFQPRTHVDPRGASETILMVEDNEDVLSLAEQCLAALGYRVITARSGEQALEIMDRAGYAGIDLLFSDVVMPGGMDGLTLVDRIRERLPDLPVLLATGYNEDLLVEDPRTTARDVLGKPYNRSALADRIHGALRRGRPARVGAPPAFPGRGPRHEG